MNQVVKDIPLLDLMSFLIETPDTPAHVGGLQIFQPVNGSALECINRMLEGFRKAPVGAPFCYQPEFPAFGWPKWTVSDTFDFDYHIRRAGLPSPGTQAQLLERVMDLHAGIMDRSRPGWIAYLIEGLEQDRFAVYWKIHHAYIDGESAIMRLERFLADTPEDLNVQPIWGPLEGDPSQDTTGESQARRSSLRSESTLKSIGTQAIAWRDVGLALGRNLLQAGGVLRREAPVPFSAPPSLFNQPVHATRHLGVASVALDRFKRLSRVQAVSINELALALVGEALERYVSQCDTLPDRPFIATCPMSIRAPGDTEASTQIAAISVKLGKPGSDLLSRVQQVHASSVDAKAEARRLSREALVNYLILVGGTADLLSKTALGPSLPPLTSVNVSNVVGPKRRCYLAGAELIRSYPVSTLAGGTAINITFNSFSDRMDYAVVSDAKAVPGAQQIADEILLALEKMEALLFDPENSTRYPSEPAERAEA